MSIYEHAGIKPFEYKVMVLPNQVEEKSKGGIILPDTVKSQMQVAVCKGKVVAVSPFAFTYFDRDMTDYEGVIDKYPETPKVGDMVLIGKYVGSEILGEDGQKYRILNDKDIIAKLTNKVAAMKETDNDR
jgi:chaperonin GroES